MVALLESLKVDTLEARWGSMWAIVPVCNENRIEVAKYMRQMHKYPLDQMMITQLLLTNVVGFDVGCEVGFRVGGGDCVGENQVGETPRKMYQISSLTQVPCMYSLAHLLGWT